MIARRYGYAIVFASVLAFGVPALAQKPANAPANATAQCTDGTFSTAKTQQGACSKHGGVKTWWGATAPAATPAPKASASVPKSSAPAAAAAPADATGQCTDGTYTKAKTQKGACSNHGGVKTWFATNSAAQAPAPTPSAATPPPPVAPKSSAAPAPSGSTPAKPAGGAKTTAPPAGTPENATAKCKDGTFSFAKGHSGACSHHGGVAEWYK